LPASVPEEALGEGLAEGLAEGPDEGADIIYCNDTNVVIYNRYIIYNI
jgi:hypothetical protein